MMDVEDVDIVLERIKMTNKNINKNLNDSKFYIFEQGFYNLIEKRTEDFIKAYNDINENKISKYRYGLESVGLSYSDFIIQFFYDKWRFKPTIFGGSTYDPIIEISSRGYYPYRKGDINSKLLHKYFGDDELILYKDFIRKIFDIRGYCGKDYKYMKEKHFYKGCWRNGTC
jgi:hypothetical protein